MKRLLIAGLVSVSLLAASHGRAAASGGGFGFGLGLNFNFTGIQKYGSNCNQCTTPGFSPYYPTPTMYGGFPYGGYDHFYQNTGAFPSYHATSNELPSQAPAHNTSNSRLLPVPANGTNKQLPNDK